MRMQWMLSAALATAAAIALAPRLEGAPAEASHAVVSITDIGRDAASRAASARLFQSLQDLRRAEDAYYARHGRYAAGSGDLPAYRAPAGADVFVTAGPGWLVVRGEVPGVAVQQLTVWRSETPGVVSGSFPAP